VKVETFDSIDDAFAVISADRVAADLRREPWQKEITPGDFVLRFEENLFIWIEVLDAVEEDRKAGADEDELVQVRYLYRAPHMEGIRFARHFSVVCPDGELGDFHVSTALCKLTREHFEAARKASWPENGPEVLGALMVAETIPPRNVLFPSYFS